MAAPVRSEATPGRRYTSFLVRCWRGGDGTERVQLEHIQSGACTRVATLAEALAWMRVCWDEPPAPDLATDGDGDAGHAGEAAG